MNIYLVIFLDVVFVNSVACQLYFTYIFAVFRLGEVDEVIIVHVLRVEQVTVLFLAQVLRVYAIGP